MTVWEQKGFEDLEEKDVSELINYKGVCRTAPATPGLLNVSKTSLGIMIFFYLRPTTCISSTSPNKHLCQRRPFIEQEHTMF